MGVPALASAIPAAMRNDYNIHDHQQRLVNDRPLQIVTRGQIPQHAGHQLLHVVVCGLAQQADQRIRAAGRLDGPLVLVVLAAVGQVPKRR